jgi:beta-glucosidase
MSWRRNALVTAGLFCVWTSCFGQQVCSNRQTQQQIDARIDTMIAQITVAERIAQLQDRAPAISGLGIPAYNWWNEGLHGLARDGYATVFPQAIGLAATWDAALLHDVGDVVSTEARAKFNTRTAENSPRYGGLTIWSPNVNIFRDPHWGRGQETYGEDPFLTAVLGTQFVEGLQGDDPFYVKADATPKHFVAHSGPEEGRDSFNAVVSTHDLADTYLPAFRALTINAHAAALMCSYNEIDGVPSCANQANLQDLVRERWGFTGYVVSDCDAVGNIAGYHHYAPDNAHGACGCVERRR